MSTPIVESSMNNLQCIENTPKTNQIKSNTINTKKNTQKDKTRNTTRERQKRNEQVRKAESKPDNPMQLCVLVVRTNGLREVLVHVEADARAE